MGWQREAGRYAYEDSGIPPLIVDLVEAGPPEVRRDVESPQWMRLSSPVLATPSRYLGYMFVRWDTEDLRPSDCCRRGALLRTRFLSFRDI